MFWERWIPKSFLIKSPVFGVECLFYDDKLVFNYCVIESKRNSISIKGTGVAYTIEELISLIKKEKAPVILSFTGKGIIHKKILVSENEKMNLENLVNQNFATVNKNDFHIQLFKSDSQTNFICLCRKEQVKHILDDFYKNSIQLVNVFIGASVVNALASINILRNYIYTSSYKISLINGYTNEVFHESKSDITESLFIDDNIIISPQNIIPFSCCFSYLTQQNICYSLDSEFNLLPLKYYQKIKINALLVFLISLFFIISVVNSVIFFQKFEQDSNLQAELDLYETKNTQITQLLESYQKKKNLIEKAGILSNKKLSVFADNIGSTLPDEIILRELYFNPLISDGEEDSLIDFQENILIIKGNCNKSLFLNEWINVLKSQNFVKNVNLENFKYQSEGEQPNFILKVETK